MNLFRSSHRPGFTILELLTTIGIVGVLAGTTIVAIDPIRQFLSARDSERKVYIKELQNAIDHYTISEGSAPATLPTGSNNKRPICREGITDGICLSLDTLTPDYIYQLPVDSAALHSNWTGYGIHQTSGQRPQVTAYYLGQQFDQSATDYIAYWRFDEITAGTTADDSSANSNDGTPQGSGGSNNLPQPSGAVPSTIRFETVRALDFDGTDDYVSAGTGVAPSSAISICAWVFIETWNTGEDQDIIVRSSTTNDGNFVFEFNNATRDGGTHRDLAFGAGGNESVLVYSGTSSEIDLNEWNNLCVTYDNTTAIIYVNGTSVASGGDGDDLTTNSETLYIGGRPGATDFTDGLLDDVRIYDRVLTAAEITAIAEGR